MLGDDGVEDDNDGVALPIWKLSDLLEPLEIDDSEIDRRTMDRVKIRFYIDPETGEPHICNHGVCGDEVEEVFLSGLGQDRVSREGSRILMGQTGAGRYLRIIYSPDPHPDSVFVITAYELKDKPLAGFKRRQRRRKR